MFEIEYVEVYNIMLCITPYHDEARDCFDDVIASVAAWSNRNYELMYSKAWSFLYKPVQTNIAPLGNSINLLPYNRYELLMKYHGIKIEHHVNKSPKYMFKKIKYELSKNLPVAIFINAFWCPTCPGYQKKETQDMHCCLVVGLDNDNTLHYVDPYYMNYNASLPKNNFVKGCKGYVTFAFSTPEEPEVDWFTIINNTYSRLKNTSDSINSFSMIRAFSDHIERSLDMTLEEAIPGTYIGEFTLIQKLVNIYKDRKQFCIVLEYIAEKYNVPALVASSKKLKNIVIKWGMVRALLCKTYLTSDLSTDLKFRIADKIRDIANAEEYIANNLLQFQSLNKNLYETSNQIYDSILYNVDLRLHFNNKSFCKSSYYNGIADFTGDGRFFLMDDFSNDNIHDVKAKKFDLTNITQNSYDNILCTNQIIVTPNERYKVLMILGSSDSNDMLDKLKIRYIDNSEVDVELGLSFYRWSSGSFSSEVLAYSGRLGKIYNDNVVPLPYNGNIYSQIFTLRYDKELESICLPYCPNMHIFAISLGK